MAKSKKQVEDTPAQIPPQAGRIVGPLNTWALNTIALNQIVRVPRLDEFMWAIEPLRRTRPDVFQLAVRLGGELFRPRATPKKIVGTVQAELARLERARKDTEIALLKAIIAVHGEEAVTEHSSAAANAILDKVNRRLKANGQKPVKVDKIRRNLEKLPQKLLAAGIKSPRS